MKMGESFQSVFNIYKIEEQIGQGGPGIVFKCKTPEEEYFAVKVIRDEVITRERLKRFKNEILFGIRNRHENIISILDYGNIVNSQPSPPFYVMPLYECSLRKLMNEGIPLDKRLPYFSQILDGIEAAHLVDVIHRDIKPENILYDSANDRMIVADFGISKFIPIEWYTDAETSASSRLANFQYAAPEQKEKGGVISGRTDIFALGLLLNELYTGGIPQGTDFRKIQSVSEEFSYLDDLVDKMIKQDPDERPVSIQEIKTLLIGYRNEFVSLQKLSRLNVEVIPDETIQDSIYLDPIKLKDFDWDDGQLSIILSQIPNEEWIYEFKNMGSHYSLVGYEPKKFSFHQNIVSISAPDNYVEEIIKYFLEWLKNVNTSYKEQKERDAKIAKQRKEEELHRQIKNEEIRKRLKETIKI